MSLVCSVLVGAVFECEEGIGADGKFAAFAVVVEGYGIVELLSMLLPTGEIDVVVLTCASKGDVNVYDHEGVFEE